MIEIDAATAIELLRQAVAERGADYVYSNKGHVTPNPAPTGACYYVHSDGEGNRTIGCLVGLALHKAGVSIDDMYGNEEDSNGLISVLGHYNKVRVTNDAREIFSRAQKVQDWKDTWGVALFAAEEVRANQINRARLRAL